MRNIYKIVVRRTEENVHLKNLNVNERITIKLDNQETEHEDVKWTQVSAVSVQWLSWEHDNET
jgi:hypothetical protein